MERCSGSDWRSRWPGQCRELPESFHRLCGGLTHCIRAAEDFNRGFHGDFQVHEYAAVCLWNKDETISDVGRQNHNDQAY